MVRKDKGHRVLTDRGWELAENVAKHFCITVSIPWQFPIEHDIIEMVRRRFPIGSFAPILDCAQSEQQHNAYRVLGYEYEYPKGKLRTVIKILIGPWSDIYDTPKNSQDPQ